MSEETARVSFHQIAAEVAYGELGRLHLDTLSDDEVTVTLKEFEEVFLPGCLGSTDCVHVRYDGCPAQWSNIHIDKTGKGSLVWQATVNRRLKFLHLTAACAGSWNDKQSRRAAVVKEDRSSIALKEQQGADDWSDSTDHVEEEEAKEQRRRGSVFWHWVASAPWTRWRRSQRSKPWTIPAEKGWADNGVVLVDLYGGMGGGLQAALSSGLQIRKYVHVDKDETAQQLIDHDTKNFQWEWKRQLGATAFHDLFAAGHDVENIADGNLDWLEDL
ncbi:hypothetical protein RI054_42g149680 [Pseudoscourfieldia marina]